MKNSVYTAVMDRFEETGTGEEVAVLLIEEDREVTAERAVTRSTLPDDARQQDAVLSVRTVDDEPVEFSADLEETASRREEVADRFDRLSTRLSDDEES